MKPYSLSLAFILTIFFSINVFAQTRIDNQGKEEDIYKNALSAYNNGDYDNALVLLRPAADRGFYKAQNLLGECYYYGKGVKKDLELAVFWFKRSAEQGYAPAQHNLGESYLFGKGVEKDVEKALYWSKKAVSQNYGSSNFIIGYIYECELQDFVSASKYYKMGAEAGYTNAMNNLGRLYEYGYGVPQNIDKAIALYNKAAQKGNGTACYNLGWCYQYGNGVDIDLEKAIYWYKKAIENGYQLDLSLEIGELLYLLNDEECYTWLNRSALSGNLIAQIGIGACLAKGIGIEKDIDKAIEIFKKAIEIFKNINSCDTIDSDLLNQYSNLGNLHLCNLYYHKLCDGNLSRKEIVHLLWNAQYGIEAYGERHWFLSDIEYKVLFDDLSKSAYFDLIGGIETAPNPTPYDSKTIEIPDILWPTNDIEYMTIQDGEEVSIGGVNFALDNGQLLFPQYWQTNSLCETGIYSQLKEINADDNFDPNSWISNDDPRLTVIEHKGFLFIFNKKSDSQTYCRIYINNINKVHKKINSIDISYQFSRIR